MIDLAHLPDHKYTYLLKCTMYLLATFDLNIAIMGFFGDVIIWGARVFVIISGSIFAWTSIISELRYRKWAKRGFKKEEKDRYRIK